MVDHTGDAVEGEGSAFGDGEGVRYGEDRGDAVFAGEDGGVGEAAAGLGDDAGDDSEEWGPGGVGVAADEDVARADAGEVGGGVDRASRAAGGTGAAGGAVQWDGDGAGLEQPEVFTREGEFEVLGCT